MRKAVEAAGRRGRLSLQEYIDGVLEGDRVTLARAITLIESDLEADIEISATLLEAVLPNTGASRRVGITGIPGAGKSTLIDTLGTYLVHERGEKVAVLSVDPASSVSGGSILGDKTRMERLCLEERAFIRPSSSRGRLGGVAPRTREAILLCEAAGFNDIFIETVGVGQAETAVHSMSDFFLLLLIPGAGDELQGTKRGIIEMVDAIAINKTDGENKVPAAHTRATYANALSLFASPSSGWIPRAVTCSALTGEGVREIWDMILEHRKQLESTGQLAQLRARQALDWMHELVALGLQDQFRKDQRVARRVPELEKAVQQGRMTPFAASRQLLDVFRGIKT